MCFDSIYTLQTYSIYLNYVHKYINYALKLYVFVLFDGNSTALRMYVSSMSYQILTDDNNTTITCPHNITFLKNLKWPLPSRISLLPLLPLLVFLLPFLHLLVVVIPLLLSALLGLGGLRWLIPVTLLLSLVPRIRLTTLRTIPV